MIKNIVKKAIKEVLAEEREQEKKKYAESDTLTPTGMIKDMQTKRVSDLEEKLALVCNHFQIYIKPIYGKFEIQKQGQGLSANTPVSNGAQTSSR
jgi:hypothetical protein